MHLFQLVPSCVLGGGLAFRERFDDMVTQVSAMARQAGFLVVDSTPLFTILEDYRASEWHFAVNRHLEKRSRGTMAEDYPKHPKGLN